MKLRSKKGFTLIELIIVIAILGIIALIAIPNLAGIRQRSQVSADKRTAEQIGKAVRIWATDVDAAGATPRTIPTSEAVYTSLDGLCPDYISDGYTAKSYKTGAGLFYVSSVGQGTNNANQKIVVGIAAAGDAATALTGDGTASSSVTVGYNGGEGGWAYQEQ